MFATNLSRIGASLCVLLCSSSPATERYVSLAGRHVPPFTTWVDAATNIQAAVDAAFPGDTIWVTNGVYANGGRAVHGVMTNRVAVTAPLTLRSVNGPEFTTIQGHPVPGVTSGVGAIRCVYLTNGAVLRGFTLTRGATQTNGNWETEQSGGGVWCESDSAVVSHCIITANTAEYGGGVYRGTLINSQVIGNRGRMAGGGGFQASLLGCVLSANAAAYGGGAALARLVNCTVTGNEALEDGGGVNECALTNSIVFFNETRSRQGSNYDETSTLDHCCTTPLPLQGGGNIDLDPHLASASHLGGGSPCVGAGTTAVGGDADIDGESWKDPPSIGCDEVWLGRVKGPLSVAVATDWTEVATGFELSFRADIRGQVSASAWDFGDGTVLSNRPFASHTWSAPGGYDVVLTAWNDENPGGVSRTVAVSVVEAPVHHVAETSVTPVPPFASWATAARSIQDAIDVATVPGAVVLVGNGVYATGGRTVAGALTNRVVIDRPLHVRSLNGPEVTTIQGAQVAGSRNGKEAVRCVWLAEGASLSGFTLTNGATRASGDWVTERSGGGVWCETPDVVVSNCWLLGNSASAHGGGVYQGTLVDCVLAGGSAGAKGGGAYRSLLTGCTIRGNTASVGGGVLLGVLSDCTLLGNSADEAGGGVHGSVLNDCLLEGNSALVGGGAHGGSLTNCTLNGNWTSGDGGGAAFATLDRCRLLNNRAEFRGGGGAHDSVLRGCVLSGNQAAYGGGASAGTLVNCSLEGNSAASTGGGASGSTLRGCALQGNHAESGGGVHRGQLYNCTLTGNTAQESGGGAHSSTLNNCIVYYNEAKRSAEAARSVLNFSCTTPLPPGGEGNIDEDPQLASPSHLSSASPCIGAGEAEYATGTDIDGDTWASPPSMGCDEYRAGANTGALRVAIDVAHTKVMVGFQVGFAAMIEGRTTDSVWDFGDGTIVANRPHLSHTWEAPGDYQVVLRARNDSHPGGVSASVLVQVVAVAHYVSASSPSPEWPYTSWETAAQVIQDAVDAATIPGALILVTNGVYAAGGRAVSGTMTNRVVLDKSVELRSVNGPEFTVIQGYQLPGRTNGDGAVRCAYLADGAVLSGFTLTQGATRSSGLSAEQSGGGVWCEWTNSVVTNCHLVGNAAGQDGGGAYRGTILNSTVSHNRAPDGGGVCGATVWNSRLTGNTAGQRGGGAIESVLHNCTLLGNSAGEFGGGAFGGQLKNCILHRNVSPTGAGGNYWMSSLDYCCTTPLPLKGRGNIDLDPMVSNTAHLWAGSPCIGAGSAAYAGGSDIDGQPWAEPPSVGCDEFLPGGAGGPLTAQIHMPAMTIAEDFPVKLDALIQGRSTAISWDLGDGVVVSNRLTCTHAWSRPGTYDVILSAWNEDYAKGTSTTATVAVVKRPIHYVAPSFRPGWPHASWGSAAHTIQEAVDAASVHGALILVTNGVYATGGRADSRADMTNRVLIDKSIEVRSVNGPEVTIILGLVPGSDRFERSEARCVRFSENADGAVLSGFTLTGGLVRRSRYSEFAGEGGGVWSASPAVTLTNCVVTENQAAYGGGASGARLVNCTLEKNVAEDAGGGAYGSHLLGCLITSNTAVNGGGVSRGTLDRCIAASNQASVYGGGAHESVLHGCLLFRNSAGFGGGVASGFLRSSRLEENSGRQGGGALRSELANCVLGRNTAGMGGGASYSSLWNCTVSGNTAELTGGGVVAGSCYNCIVYHNFANASPNYLPGTLEYCCTAPRLFWGVGNITNAPLFLDPNNWRDPRLQPDSPCINAGNNVHVSGEVDLDGHRRIAGGTVDMGAYEVQHPSSVISYAWLQNHGLPTDGTADFIDSDLDRMNNWGEWKARTDPANASSVLRLHAPFEAPNGVVLTWQSEPGVLYLLERSTNLTANPAFEPIAVGIPSRSHLTSFTDTNRVETGSAHYRVGVTE